MEEGTLAIECSSSGETWWISTESGCERGKGHRQRGLCGRAMGQTVGAALGVGTSNQMLTQSGHPWWERKTGESYEDTGLERGFSLLFCFFSSST